MSNIHDNEKIAAYLRSLEPGYLPYDIFVQIARLVTVPVVELVPLRLNASGGLEVFLMQRPAGDIWDRQWHVPGVVIRSGDALAAGDDYSDPLVRLLGPDGELQGVRTVGDPVIVETERRRSLRGDEIAVVHYVELAEEPANGRFFALDDTYPANVPANGIVPHHVDFVRRAGAKFLQDKQN